MYKENSHKLIISVGTTSIIGTRKDQQDCAYVETTPASTFAVVCDGMGGLNGGALASQTAVSNLATDYESLQPINNIAEFYKDEAKKLDTTVYELTDESGSLLHAGTTIVSTIIQNDQLYCLAVGDSRIYFIRNNEIVPINRDHNYRLRLDHALQNGLITPELYAMEEPKADSLISYLGIGNLSLIDINSTPFQLQEDDCLLLCSDGLYKALNDEIIYQICVEHTGDAQSLSEALINQAILTSMDSLDNTTVVVLKMN